MGICGEACAVRFRALGFSHIAKAPHRAWVPGSRERIYFNLGQAFSDGNLATFQFL
jgi:hypothetical protein